MNLGELRAKVSRKVGFTSASPDQDFAGPASDTWKYIDDGINEAYADECSKAQNEAGSHWFRRVVEATWPSGEQLFVIPDAVKQSQIYAIMDVTGDTGRGRPLYMGGILTESSVTWREPGVLEWRDAGPGSDVDLRFHYVASAVRMTTATQEPELIPEAHRWLLVWSAACILRDEADEAAPGRWISRRDELRKTFHKQLSKARPMATGPWGTEDSYYAGA